MKSKARDQSIQARKKLFFHVIVKNYLCNVSRKFDQNGKHIEARNQRTVTPAYFTAPKQPPDVFYKKAVLKNSAISAVNTCVGV